MSSRAVGAAPETGSARRREGEDLRGPVGDAVEAYLQEIGRVALLTAEEEVDLATRMEAGLRAQALAEQPHPPDLDAVVELARLSRVTVAVADPSPQAVAELLTEMQSRGRAAKARLIEANLRLVVSIAKRYRGHGMQLLDLVQEGNLGLIRGVEKFDPSRGFKFSTYASWWIRQAIARAIANRDRTVRLPVHLVDSVHTLKRAQSELIQELGRVPGLEDIAERMGVGREEVRRLLDIGQETVSLDVPIDSRQNVRLCDFIEDTEAQQPVDAVCTILLQERLEGVLGSLPDRERRVIELRYGLRDGAPRTLEQIGCVVGLSREQVSHVERRAISKLRHPCAAHHLHDFFE